MIIKRNLKTQMPSLKRCKLGESTGDDDEKSSRKKRKTNGYYPLNLLDQLAAGIIPMSFNKLLGSAGVDKGFSASWCTEVTYSPEVEFKSKDRESTRDKINGKVEAQRPPLVRTSRGRVQVLPSRFNDSVIENWKKESKTSLPEYGSDYEIEIENKKDKFSFRTPKMCSQNSKKMNIEDRSRYNSRKYTALCEEEGEEEGCVGGYKSLNGRKFYNSRSLGYEKLTENDRRLCEVTEEQVDLEDDGRFSKANHARKDGLYGPEDFYSGDIVWAKPARKEPFWPAIVIDPFSQAPEPVLRACIADAACVMFFGYSGTKDHRDYAWVKRGMIFPLMDHVDRFQEQSELNDYKPNDFQMAIEEAFLAERGFTEKLTKDIKLAAGNSAFDESIIRGIRDTTGLYHGTEDHFLNKDAIGKNKDARSCEGCGLSLPFKLTKKMKISTQGGQLLCKTCARLTKSKHYCGICKKIWNHSDSGSWVRCDGCKVWVHAECDKISSNLFKNLGATDYYCPACKAKFNFELSDSEKGQPKVKWSKNDGQPNKVTVLCNGIKGIYFPSLHLVVCKCGFCGTEKQALSDWERHTGSKSKNWKTSVKVKSSMLPLEQWMLQLAEYHASALVSGKPPKRPSIKERKQKLLAFLQEKYEPLYAKLTTERCAVCRWVEDWDYNKIIICNRCQIAVHQECYGARNVRDFTSWVCKACETPEIKRECCLCPVKGGALKPTDVETLWVHVTCAWFRPEVSFASDEKMEPALGILSIPSNSFVKICVICKQIHGSCTQCCKCSTYYHAMCASRAGYRMELHCLEKNGKQITKMISYCAYHRAPNPDTVLIIQTPLGVFSTKSLLQNKNKAGSRLISSNGTLPKELPTDETTEPEPLSAARCRVFKRSTNSRKRREEEAIGHHVKGNSHHPLDMIRDLNAFRVVDEPPSFSSFRERLYHLQRTEDERVCFGRSGIHGWGLFARRHIQEGEMVLNIVGNR